MVDKESTGQSQAQGGLKTDSTVLNPSPFGGKSIIQVIEENGGAPVTNFDGDQLQQWKLRSIATGGSCRRFDDQPAEGIDLKYFYAHRVEVENVKTGVVSSVIRIVLFDQDDLAYGFVSDQLPKSIDDLVQMFGWGPWKMPAKVKVTENKSRTGMRFYTLSPML